MIELIIETVIGTLLIVLIAFLSYRVYSLKRMNNDLVATVLQEGIDKNAISQKLQDTLDLINNTNVEDKDGFIRFLSQSRQWAFDYIEDVQLAIAKLSEAMETSDEQKILEAYNNIITYMPSEDNKEK